MDYVEKAWDNVHTDASKGDIKVLIAWFKTNIDKQTKHAHAAKELLLSSVVPTKSDSDVIFCLQL